MIKNRYRFGTGGSPCNQKIAGEGTATTRIDCGMMSLHPTGLSLGGQVGVGVMVTVGVSVNAGVPVAVGVRVLVDVAVGVSVAVGVALAGISTHTPGLSTHTPATAQARPAITITSSTARDNRIMAAWG